MNKLRMIVMSTIFVSMLVVSPVIANAQAVRTVGKTETLQKSQFLSGQEVSNEGIIKGDLFAGAQTIDSAGVVRGDLIVAGNSILSSGLVTGDILGAGNSVDISGDVGGNIRSAGSDISIDGKVGKNVNTFAGTTRIKKGTQIGGNLLAFGEYIRIDGKVKQYTKIYANRVVLNGEFFGDVDINADDSNGDAFPSSARSGKTSQITILPGTIIHGKLTYRSAAKTIIPKGATVRSHQWIKSVPRKTSSVPSAVDNVMSFAKMLLGTFIYFLLAMLLLKLFPKIFKRQSDPIHDKPLQTAGIGLAAILSIFAVFVGLIILTIFSILLGAFSLSFVTGMMLTVFYIALFYLAAMPVSLWLGSMLFKERYTVPIRFALGLGIISVIQFTLSLLGGLPSVGALFGFIHFIVVFGVLLLGIGASLKMTGMILGSIREYDPIAE